VRTQNIIQYGINFVINLGVIYRVRNRKQYTQKKRTRSDRAVAQTLVFSLSSRRSGFNPGPDHVRFVNKVAMVEDLSEYFVLPLSVSFHQFYILIFTLILPILERKFGDFREISDSG
jgi:hypothetical protein